MTTTSEPKPLSSRPAKALLWLLLPFAAGEAALAQCSHGGAVTGLRDLSKPSGPPQPGQPNPCTVKKPPQQPGQGGGQIPLPPLGGALQALPNDPAGPTVQILWTDHGNQNIVGATPSVPAGVGIPVRAVCTAKDGGQTGLLWAAAASLTGGFEGSEDKGGLRPIGLADPVTHVQHQEATIYGAFPGSHPLLRLLCQDAQGRRNTGDVRFTITGPVLKIADVPLKEGQRPALVIHEDSGTEIVSRRVVELKKGQTTVGETYLPWLGPVGNLKQIPPVIANPRSVIFDAFLAEVPFHGEFQWVQILSTYDRSYKHLDGTVQHCADHVDLDTSYPYILGAHMQDTPGIFLDKKNYSEESLKFKATTYLMWRDNPNATFVPLASKVWGFDDVAVQDNDPKLLDKFTDSKHSDMSDKSLGWRALPGSTPVVVEKSKAATTLKDFPFWRQKTSYDQGCP